MKKCKECDQEIDKYSIACQYCGKLAEERAKSENQDGSETKDADKNPDKQ